MDSEEKCPTNARGGREWALLELTDAEPKYNGNKFLYFLLYTYAANKSTLMMFINPKSEKRQPQKSMIWKQNCCHGNISQVSLVTGSVVSFNIHKYFKNEKRMKRTNSFFILKSLLLFLLPYTLFHYCSQKRANIPFIFVQTTGAYFREQASIFLVSWHIGVS